MTPFTFFLLSLVFSVGHVLAGSRLWQPPPPLPNKTASSSSHLGRRFFHINPVTRGTRNDQVIWPNKQIRYCFNTPQSRTALRSNLKAAHERWVTTGLGKDFTFVEVGPDECTQKRADVLRISYVGPTGGMTTYVGFPAPDANLRRIPTMGPSMYLTDDPTMGMLDVVANYAHELGHAWGLYHEHQNPAFRKGVVPAAGGSVFGPDNEGNWRCENLKDYSSAMAALAAETKENGYSLSSPKDLCTKWIVADTRKFSASDYLPLLGERGVAHSSGKGPEDVDWASIMIYPSGAGAIEDPTSTEVDRRMPILLRLDGSRIPINEYPSQLDIQGLRGLYGSEPAAKGKLLQEAGGRKSDMFKKLFSISKGSSSSCL